MRGDWGALLRPTKEGSVWAKTKLCKGVYGGAYSLTLIRPDVLSQYHLSYPFCKHNDEYVLGQPPTGAIHLHGKSLHLILCHEKLMFSGDTYRNPDLSLALYGLDDSRLVDDDLSPLCSLLHFDLPPSGSYTMLAKSRIGIRTRMGRDVLHHVPGSLVVG